MIVVATVTLFQSGKVGGLGIYGVLDFLIGLDICIFFRFRVCLVIAAKGALTKEIAIHEIFAPGLAAQCTGNQSPGWFAAGQLPQVGEILGFRQPALVDLVALGQFERNVLHGAVIRRGDHNLETI